MADAARKPVTLEDLHAEIRALRAELADLREDRKAQRVDAPTPTAVGRKAPRKVRRDREPPPEAYDDVINMRKRRGGDGA